MTSLEKRVEEILHAWDKHYSLVAHTSLVSGDLADEEIKDWLRTTLTTALEEQREEIVKDAYDAVSEWVTHNAKTIQNNNGATEYIEVRELLTLLETTLSDITARIKEDYK